MTLRTPVLIVGGGPVGLATAMELQLHRVDCIVVEPRLEVSHARPRAKTTTARTMELFRRWGFAETIRARAPIPVSWSSDIVFCTTVTGREISRFTESLGLGLHTSDATAEAGQQIPQPVVEEALRDALVDASHATAMFGWRAISVNEGASTVVVTVEDASGAIKQIEADYVIGADGPRSVIRLAMGSQYLGAPTGRPNLSITFRSRQLRGRIPHGNAIHYWVVDQHHPGVVGPLDLIDTWWAISTGRPEDDADRDPVAIVRALIGAEVDIEVIETDPWQARSLVVDHYRSGRMFVVGDAAHQNPPWGGHGFNTGVGDAVNLGWKLAGVLHGWAPDELLDTYETERRPISEQTIAIAENNSKFMPSDFLVSSEADDQEVAERIQAAKKVEFHSLGLVLGYNYGPDSAIGEISDYSPLSAAGHRLPHSYVEGEVSIYDLLGSGFAVLGDTTALAAAFDRTGVPVVTVQVDTRALYGVDVVVVRPDQHIAWLGSSPTRAEATAIVEDAIAGRWSALAAQ